MGLGGQQKEMKPKQILLCLLLIVATTVNAQTILKGDMNNDAQVTIADVTSLVNVILGKAPQETISMEPYKVDNTSVVGTWYAPDGTSFNLNEDGTTNYPGATTYKFRPFQGTLMLFNASGNPIKTLVLNEVESSYLLAINYATGTYTYYTNSGSLVTTLTMSESTLSMNSGSTHQLMVVATPPDAFNPNVFWSSSDESVATVDQNGLVTGVAGGTCNITATATDGSGQTVTCAVTVIQMVTSITLSQTSLGLELEGYKKLIATIMPSNAANTKVTWSSSDESVAEVTSTGGVAAVGKGKCTITCTASDGSGVTATCIVWVGYEIEYVDLALPSGTLWATCNVGAETPEDYGDYFAWGETEGYNSGKTTFNWDTYKWCNGDEDHLTKYCSNSIYGDNGFTDNKTELDLEDDAAYLNWGNDWRMPSEIQCRELINENNTITEWITQNGVNGRKITSKTNGNSIFLPAAGYRFRNLLQDAGSSGRYWMRTYSIDKDVPWYWGCTVDGMGLSDNLEDRCFGKSVRPVRNQ